MTKLEFLALMKFPKEWDDWAMYPDELFEGQCQRYKRGDEDGADHDRNEAFDWWLRRDLTAHQRAQLLKLAELEPDAGLAADVRQRLG